MKDSEWSLDGTVLTQSTNITYLGANLSNTTILNRELSHVEKISMLCSQLDFARAVWRQITWLIYGRLQSNQFYYMLLSVIS